MAGLDDILAAAVPDEGIQGGQPAPGGEVAPAAGQQNAGNGEAPAVTGAGLAGGGETGAEDASIQQLLEQVRRDKPELAPLAEELQKSFQRGYTSKFEEVSALKKQLEAQQQQYQAYALLEQVAQQDPGLARQILAAQLGLTDGSVPAAESGNDPYGQIELTETERLLATQLQQVAAQQQQFQQFYEQQTRQQQLAKIEAEFANLSRAIGREIPPEEQQRIAAFSVQHNGIPVDVAYRAMNYDNALKLARQDGLNQGAAVVQQKAGMAPAPATAADRAGRVTEPSRDLHEIATAAYEAAGS